MSDYPKISQEQFLEAFALMMGVVKDPQFLENSPYSDKFRELVKEKFTVIRLAIKDFNSGELSMAGALTLQEAGVEVPVSAHNSRAQDVLAALDYSIAELKKIVAKQNSDAGKVSAIKQLHAYNLDRVKMMQQMADIGRIQKLDGVVKQFFRELAVAKAKEVGGTIVKTLAKKFLDILDNELAEEIGLEPSDISLNVDPESEYQ